MCFRYANFTELLPSYSYSAIFNINERKIMHVIEQQRMLLIWSDWNLEQRLLLHSSADDCDLVGPLKRACNFLYLHSTQLVMILTRPSTRNETKQTETVAIYQSARFAVYSHAIKFSLRVIDSFIYLGISLQNNGNWDTEIHLRIQRRAQAFGDLQSCVLRLGHK